MASERQLTDLEGSFRFAETAIKMLIGINGGAAIAVLTFYGNLLSAPDPVAIGARTLGIGLGCFGIGVALAAVSALSAFMVQTYRAGDDSPDTSTLASGWWSVGVPCGFGAVICFLAGLGFAAAALPIW